MQEMEQVGGGGGPQGDRNTLNKLMSLHPGLSSSMNNNQQLPNRGPPYTGSALALTNYQNMLMRQNSINAAHQQEASSPFNTSNHTPTTPGPSLTQRPPSPVQQNQSLQQQMIQQLLQDMSNKNNANGNVNPQNQGRDGFGFRTSPAINAPSRSNSFNAEPPPPPPAPAPGPGNVGFSEKASDMGQNLHIADELDVAHDFSENSFFNNDLDDVTFDWKA